MSAPRGARIPKSDELLFRQVHPTFVHDGVPTSQAFRPTPKDKELLSCQRQSKIASPSESYRVSVEKGAASAGVMAVSIVEVEDRGLGAYDDEETAPIPDPAHAVIDFRNLSGGAAEKHSKALKAKAVSRDWLFRP